MPDQTRLLASIAASAIAVVGAAYAFLWRTRQQQFPRADATTSICTLPNGGLPTVDDGISILSWNTLCDSLVNANRSAYSQAPLQDLVWSNRWPRMARQLIMADADVLALQEVDANRWDDFLQALAPYGYQGILQTQRKDSRLTFSLAFLYKASRVSLLWHDSRSRTHIAAFQQRHGSQRSFYIVNCHLEGHPYRAAERVSQLRATLKRLVNKLTANKVDPSTAAVLVVGDLNSTMSSCTYRFLVEGGLPAGAAESYMPGVPVTTEDIAHPFVFVDAYQHARNALPFTFKGSRNGSVIDFILHTPDLAAQHVLQPLATVQELRLAQRNNMPNRLHPSDHLQIGAVLVGTATDDGVAEGVVDGVVEDDGGSMGVEEVNGSAEGMTHSDDSGGVVMLTAGMVAGQQHDRVRVPQRMDPPAACVCGANGSSERIA